MNIKNRLNKFIGAISFEMKWTLKDWIVTGLLLLMFVMGFLFLQVAITGYKGKIAQAKAFQKQEKFNTSFHRSYRGYAVNGIGIKYMPPTFNIFVWNSGVNSEIDSHIDSSGQFKINHPFLKSAISNITRFFTLDFAGMIYIFGSLFGILMGWKTLRKIEYLKTLASISSSGNVFLRIVAARCLVILGVITATIFSGLLLSHLNNLHIPLNKAFIGFWLKTVFISFLAFFIGIWCGTIRERVSSHYALFILWISVFFIIPCTFQLVSASLSNLEESLKPYEIRKFKLVTDFDMKAEQIAGALPFGAKIDDKHREIAKGISKNVIEKIISLEVEELNLVNNVILDNDGLMSLFPTSNYMESLWDMGGTGYQSLKDFAHYTGTMKSEFMRYFIKKAYLTPGSSDFTPVESFIKGDENVYKGKSTLTGNPWKFYSIVIGVFLLLGFDSYRRFKKSLNKEYSGNPKPPDVDSIPLKYGQAYNMDGVGNSFYILFAEGKIFFNQHGYIHNVRVDAKEVGKLEPGKEFLYVCHPKSLPDDIPIRSLIVLFGKLLEVPNEKMKKILETVQMQKKRGFFFTTTTKKERGEVILALLQMVKPGCIVIANKPTYDTHFPFVKELVNRVEDLKQDKSVFLNLCADWSLEFKLDKKRKNGFAMEDFSTFIPQVENFKEVAKDHNVDIAELVPNIEDEDDFTDNDH